MKISIDYDGTEVRSTWLKDDLWIAMKDVALLVGRRNPRNMMQGLGRTVQERVLVGEDTKGRSVKMIHIPSANVMALINKSRSVRKNELLSWLQDALEKARKQAGGVAMTTSTDVPKNKTKDIASQIPKKARAKAYAIKVEDYAKLTGRSYSTIYAWIKRGKLGKTSIFKKLNIELENFYFVTERDLDYDLIAKHLECDQRAIGIAMELEVEIIGKIET